MSYTESSRRARSVGRKTPSTAVTRTGTTPHRKTKWRRGAPCALGKVRLPHRDLDTAVARLRRVVGSLDEQVALAGGGHFDRPRGETCLHENMADTEHALPTDPAACLGVNPCGGMTDG